MGGKREGIESEEFLLNLFYVRDSERKPEGKEVAARCENSRSAQVSVGVDLKSNPETPRPVKSPSYLLSSYTVTFS